MGICVGCEKPKTPVKVLILGLAASGKSTFLKQVQFINTGSFGERNDHKDLILQNMVCGIQELLLQAEKFQFDLEENNRKYFRWILSESPFVEYNESLINMVKILWKDEAIQKTWELRSTFPMQIKHLGYLMENVDRMTSPNFVPSNDDLLLIRMRTTGVVNVKICIDGFPWEFYDVGGQKSERDKWDLVISEGVDAVVFISALDEYAMLSKDENKTNIQVSMSVFQEVMSYAKLGEVPKLLFLNKLDLFQKQLSQEDGWDQFQKAFPDYESEKNVESAYKYIAKQFTQPLMNNGIKLDSVHIGSCLKSNYITTIFKTIQKSIEKILLINSGLVL